MARRQALRELLRLRQHAQTLSAKHLCGAVGRSPQQHLLPAAFLHEEFQQSKTRNSGAAWMFAAAGAGILCSSSTAFAGSYLSTEAATEIAAERTASKNELPSLSTPTKSRVVFVLGGPGSGKGTQCTKIVDEFGFVHLSAGDLLRAEINSGSNNGNMIKAMIKEGTIVPAEVTVKLLQKAMESSGQDKFLIDGFPRNEENRLCFEEVTGIQPEFILFFECSEAVMEKRLLGRNQGRIDDNIETIRKRFRTFEQLSLPVVNHYEQEGKVRKINATKAPDDVFKALSPLFLRFLQEDLVEASRSLIDAIDGGDYAAYARLCDSGLTAFEPEAQGQLVEGMAFHKFYFDLLDSQPVDASAPAPLSTLASPQMVIIGDVGIMTYTRLKQKVGTPLEGFVDASNETRVWHRRKMEGGGYEWKHVHFHRSKAPTE